MQKFPSGFQQLLEECTIGTLLIHVLSWPTPVSVVVRRMYYWDFESISAALHAILSFSSCQKNVLLGLNSVSIVSINPIQFQQLLEECTIGTRVFPSMYLVKTVSVVVRRMYYWDSGLSIQNFSKSCFSSCQKNVLLGRTERSVTACANFVSVVVRRMYYWDSKRNRLKTKDFDRLNSELFFENARSARKVVLFSKNWGDCLTIQNISGNI